MLSGFSNSSKEMKYATPHSNHEEKISHSTLDQENIFKTLIKNKTFVDKSLFIAEVIKRSYEHIRCFLRPAGSGKTVNLRMLECFFDNTLYDENIFKDLAILQKHPEMKQHMGQYPVIFLSFSEFGKLQVDTENYDEAVLRFFNKLFQDLYTEHAKRYPKSTVSFDFNTQYDEAELLFALSNLLEKVYLSSGKKPIILVDDYDTILFKTSLDKRYNFAATLLRDVLSPVLKDNENLELAILTGITRLPAENFRFRALNNIIYETLLHPTANDFFGFTDENVKMLLERFNLKNNDVIFETMKKHCVGFHIKDTHLFNPQLVMQRITNPEAIPTLFLENDIRIQFIKKYISTSADLFLDIFTSLKGHKINIFMTLQEHTDADFLTSVLFLMGFLTVHIRFCVGDTHKYFLQPPHQTAYTFFKAFLEPLREDKNMIPYRSHLTGFKNESDKPVVWHILKATGQSKGKCCGSKKIQPMK